MLLNLKFQFQKFSLFLLVTTVIYKHFWIVLHFRFQNKNVRLFGVSLLLAWGILFLIMILFPFNHPCRFESGISPSGQSISIRKKIALTQCFQPPDDPYGIKKDDLVSSLRKCLAATNQFAPVS